LRGRGGGSLSSRGDSAGPNPDIDPRARTADRERKGNRELNPEYQRAQEPPEERGCTKKKI